MDFEQKVDSKIDARKLITEKIFDELSNPSYERTFDQYQSSPQKS